MSCARLLEQAINTTGSGKRQCVSLQTETGTAKSKLGSQVPTDTRVIQFNSGPSAKAVVWAARLATNAFDSCQPFQSLGLKLLRSATEARTTHVRHADVQSALVLHGHRMVHGGGGRDPAILALPLGASPCHCLVSSVMPLKNFN
eukprot:2257717-Amphidinium_carterae.1